MAFRLLALRTRRPVQPPAPRYFRPRPEGFEDRVVPAAPLADAAQVAPPAATSPLVVTDVNLTNFQIVNNVLTAAGTVTGTLFGMPFTTQIDDFALNLIPDDPATSVDECSVLHLELAPIHLALLGLHVDTSPICLDITATEGGGLLGDLLCGLAGGGPLGTGIPIIPIGGALDQLVDGLIDVLNGVLGGLGDGGGGGGGGGDVCTGDCEILDLSLGPIDLSLLGLDDCSDGPVQVCVSATRSEGRLGSLLCGLSGAQVINLSVADLTTLGTAAAAANADGVLSGKEAGLLTALLGRPIR